MIMGDDTKFQYEFAGFKSVDFVRDDYDAIKDDLSYRESLGFMDDYHKGLMDGLRIALDHIRGKYMPKFAGNLVYYNPRTAFRLVEDNKDKSESE